MKKFILILGVLLSFVACKTQYLPITGSTETTVNVKDSLVLNIKDSVTITEKTRYKDFVWMGDTLRLNGSRSRAWAVADTLKGAIVGEIEEDPIKENTHIEYRDRIHYRDSVREVEKPVPYPVEVEKRYVPKVYKVLSSVGIISILSLLVLLGIKIYRLRWKGFLNLIKNLFKRPQF